ncbi:hypothetical protein [Fundidesulfovibrio soli]|uniref:hypothetical protein n=1 Tax=Fundidesulfovibrio soli TaxID=2922716 RepID=UPI001FAFFFBE|nr:hypothetical protein [Fundidesulfovibrio soli]
MGKGILIACLALAGLGLSLAGECQARDVTGRYVYNERGYKGTMTISRMGPGFVFKFKTTSLSNGQMCDFETFETPMDEGGGRVDDDLPAKGGTKDDGIKFTISFKGDTALVDAESKGGECGMSGYFGGTYRKAK